MEEPDSIVWKFNSNGRYSVKSLYAVVNDRGVRQIFSPVMWKIIVPLRIHVFLWLVGNNKILNRDNLSKCKTLDDVSCLFCSEPQTVSHLLFEFCVAKCAWEALFEILKIQLGRDFESVAKLWLQNKKYKNANIVTSAMLWTLWKFHNDLVFQGTHWTRMGEIFGRYARSIKNWRMLLVGEAEELENCAEELELRSSRMPKGSPGSLTRKGG
jgi:hypothetical protein